MRRLFYNGRVLAEEGPLARGYVVTAGRTILDVGEGVYSGPTGTPETLDERCRRQFR